MKAAKTGSKEARTTEQNLATAPLDSGETRAVVLAAAVIAIFLYFIKAILLPFLLAAILAYICTPLLDWLARRTRWPRLLFAIAAFLIILGITALVLVFATQHVAVEVRIIAADLPGMLERLARETIGDQPVHLFGYSLGAHEIAQSALERVRDLLGETGGLAIVTGYSLATVMGAFMTVVLLFYFLASGHTVARGLFWIVPPHRRALVARIWARLDPVLMRYFIGVFVVVVYATAASYVGLGVILGIRHAVLLALLTGILETVPFIGPTSAAILAGLVALRTATGLMSIFAYAGYAVVLRLSIDQLVGPIVLGRAAHVHPVLIIFCFLAGGVLFGIPGLIIAVPVALLIRSTLATLYGDADA
jgi:predicted PurR-regulated permease PerM